MFQLIFGIIWTAFSVFMAFSMYNSEGSIQVNGRPVSQEEFNQMLFPKIFIGIFILIGVIFMCIGLKKIITNILTHTVGEEAHGLVIRVYPSGTRVNGRPELKADVLVVVDNLVNRYSEIIGFDWNKYRAGDFVLIKHYKKDINIKGRIDRRNVPYQTVQLLENDEYAQEMFARKNRGEYTEYNQYQPQRIDDRNDSDW